MPEENPPASQGQENTDLPAGRSHVAQSGTINIEKFRSVTSKTGQKIADLHKGNNENVDAAEIVSLVKRLLKDQHESRIYWFTTISLALVHLVLAGALLGFTWLLLEANKDTKVSANEARNYQYLLTKYNKPAVTGGVVIDLTVLIYEAPAVRTNISSPSLNPNGRRRLSEANLTYIGTIPIATALEGCDALMKGGVATFLVTSANGSSIPGGKTINKVEVLEQAGCSPDGSTNNSDIIKGIVRLNDNFTSVVTCSKQVGSCIVQVDASGLDPETQRLLQSANILPSIGGASHLCFPADATVEVLGRGPVRLDDLQYGDLVQSRDRTTGQVVHRPVYLFGHREASDMAPYVHIRAGKHTLAATANHFVPVCKDRCTPEELAAGAADIEYRYAGDVRVGDTVIVIGSNAQPVPASVSHMDTFGRRGFMSPFVRGADMFVDGVLASSLHEWLLDAVTPAPLVRYLPHVYEVFMAPVYGIYCLVGPATMEWLAQDAGIMSVAATPGLMTASYVAFLLAFYAAPATLLALAARGVSRRVRGVY